MGVFIEPPQCVVGLRGPADHYVYRTQPEGARSGPGDTDLVMYSLRRYLRLAPKPGPISRTWSPSCTSRSAHGSSRSSAVRRHQADWHSRWWMTFTAIAVYGRGS